jgi:zinc and cadmium transporter
MSVFFQSLLSVIVISLGSLIGVFSFAFNTKKTNSILLFLVALSAGALMGSAFIHLLPEAALSLPPVPLFHTILISFIFFFTLEKIFLWRHCHDGICDVHSFGFMNLVGDAVHNFIDGLIIAATFITSPHLGLITTLAVALHEIPQEFGDFGVLLYSGYSKKKALISNFLVATTSVLGVFVGFLLNDFSHSLLVYLVPFAAGGFIYIAASDLLPEIRKETSLRKSMISFGIFLIGIVIMYLTSLFE